MGVIDGVINIGLQAWNNKVQREENRKARQWDLKMWNLQNEYNSPSAQMQRFEDAGLNPNLMYGQGSPGNAASVGTPGAAHVGMDAQVNLPNAMAAIDAYQNFLLKKNNIQTSNWNALTAGEEFRRAKNTNDYLFGGVKFLNPKSGKFYDTFYDADNPVIGGTKFANLKNLEIENQRHLAELRKSEAGMAGSLKGWNLTAADEWYTRLIAKWMENTSFDKFRRK